jgi:hypothetical protein
VAEQSDKQYGQIASGLAAVIVLVLGGFWFTGLPALLER